ncbi:MAG: hydrogenase nickel incorporation protein HypB [Lachnospiraceae bacterium]|nr:hydrogenase nickel incorporation protein HypB [Lachnospiraceae bacterium]
MDQIQIIELKKTLLENNDADADLLRKELLAERTFYLNVMSSPGSGKTSSILRLIEQLRERLRIGVLEADIDGDVDTGIMLAAGVPSVQLHTGGMCHLDAEMSRQGLRAIGSQKLDLVILENVGNLVCPAEFDTGAVKNLVILSVPEGDDKPLKYPLMFEKADAVLVNKMDAADAFDFDLTAFEEHVRLHNQTAPVFPVSAVTGQGFEEAAKWLYSETEKCFSGGTDHE